MKHPSDELYHVREDHGQQYDAAAERPDIVKRLKISIGDMFIKLNAPSEQWDRLGLREVGYEG
jgi:hypothetical protein